MILWFHKLSNLHRQEGTKWAMRMDKCAALYHSHFFPIHLSLFSFLKLIHIHWHLCTYFQLPSGAPSLKKRFCERQKCCTVSRRWQAFNAYWFVLLLVSPEQRQARTTGSWGTYGVNSLHSVNVCERGRTARVSGRRNNVLLQAVTDISDSVCHPPGQGTEAIVRDRLRLQHFPRFSEYTDFATLLCLH